MHLGKAFSDEITKQKDLFNRADKRKIGGARDWQDGFLGFPLCDRGETDVGRRSMLVKLAIISVLLIFVNQLFRLQILEGRQNLVLAEENRVFVKRSSARRGFVRASDGEVIARNRPGFRVSLLASRIPVEDKDEIINSLSEVLQMDKEEIVSIVDRAELNPFTTLTVKNDISHTQQISLAARGVEMPGVLLEESLVRDYPAGSEFSNFLGYVGRLSLSEFRDVKYYQYRADDFIGKAGLEKQYEDVLRGEADEKLVEVDARGREVRILEEREGKRGGDLVISIRADWQKKVSEILEKGIEKYAATGGVVVLQEAQTGRLLSLVTSPTFDNQLFAGGIKQSDYQSLINDSSQPLFNRAVSGTYPPGSTVKPAVAVAALSEKIIDENTRLSDYPQIIRIGVWEFPDWTVAWNRGAHGLIDVRGAIAQSCDTFFYKVGGGYSGNCEGSTLGCNSRGLGVEKLAEYYRLFGFGESTRVDLPGESVGLVPDPAWKNESRGEPWFLGNTYHLSIGQGDLLTTPLQIVNYISAVANGGRLMNTKLALRIEGGNGGVQTLIEPEILREDYVGADYLRIAREGMRLAVTDGIIYPLRAAKTSVAAKTGTAEFGTQNAEGEYETHAWVTGFFPYEDPKMSFVVLLESGGASNNAAEVSREIIDWLVDNGDF